MRTRMEKRYKITVNRPNQKTLTYTVDDYKVIEGTLIEFIDKKTGRVMQLDSRLLEIEVISDE
jgi:hypothetical protein